VSRKGTSQVRIEIDTSYTLILLPVLMSALVRFHWGLSFFGYWLFEICSLIPATQQLTHVVFNFCIAGCLPRSPPDPKTRTLQYQLLYKAASPLGRMVPSDAQEGTYLLKSSLWLGWVLVPVKPLSSQESQNMPIFFRSGGRRGAETSAPCPRWPTQQGTVHSGPNMVD
jgi:hypothetical protein